MARPELGQSPQQPAPRPRRIRRRDSLPLGALAGIAAVTAATLLLALAGAIVAAVVALFY